MLQALFLAVAHIYLIPAPQLESFVHPLTIMTRLPFAPAWRLPGETRAPMGVLVSGGLVSSTILTLIVVPVLYSLVDGFSSRLLRLIGRKTALES
jgi:multidrug efflux pump subunit AcrB